MKCKVCGGAGVIQGQAPGLVSCCPACDGKGFIEQTNEEWFCQLSTEEKAKWLEEKMTWAAQEQGTFTAKGWEMWLKQQHNRKEDEE